MNSYAPARFPSPTAHVFTSPRPAGSSRSAVVSRSPYAVSESVRGIGVAVMCSARGALANAEAVLLVDHCEAEPCKLDVGLEQRVRADRKLLLAGREPPQRIAA